MKATGVVRKTDGLGRIVLPMELRKTFNIEQRDPLEIFVDHDGNSIILKKYEPLCTFCGNGENVERKLGKNICQSCLKDLRTLNT